MYKSIVVNFLKNPITVLRQSEYIKNVTTLTTGVALSQIIPLLASPFIARLYSPNDYGVLAAYTSVAILLTMVATGSYDAALMLDGEDYEAINTGSVAIAITLIITVFSFITMILFRESIAKLTANNNVSFWLYFVPLTVFFAGTNQTLTMWNNRKKRYKLLASNRIILTLCTTALTLSFGFIGLKEKGLLISMIVGQSIAFVVLFGQTVFNDKGFFHEIKTERLKRSFIKHLDFLKYNMPQGFFDSIKESGTLLIISNFFGAYALGSFSFAYSMIMKPLQFIGSATAQVFYQRANYIYNQTGNIYHITKKTFLALFMIGLPFALLILFFGGDIFIFVFSNKWKDAGIYSQILIPWIFLIFVTSPLSTIPLMLKKQKKSFYYSIFSRFMPIIILFIAGYIGMTDIHSLISFSFANSLFFILILVWFYTLIRTKPAENK